MKGFAAATKSGDGRLFGWTAGEPDLAAITGGSIAGILFGSPSAVDHGSDRDSTAIDKAGE